ncbi:MAG: helix-turn-helix transcriptional regulator [Clostridium sp.]|nr:helix-turn-helix transcriptional regulator [Clostridium sp.]
MNIEIANRLVNLRKSNNLSQEALAEKLGISRQAVSKWERAEASPDTDNLILLARLYHISLDELLRTEDEIPMPEAEAVGDRAREFGKEEIGGSGEGSGSFFIPMTFIIIIVYFIIGTLGAWHPGWILFLLIPLWNSLVSAIRHENANYFAYPILATVIYLCGGFFWSMWHPGWIIFLTIPLYYSVISYARYTKGKKSRSNFFDYGEGRDVK